MFKNLQDYLEQREALLAKAETLAGDQEAFENALKNVEDLDASWESQSQAMANVAALRDKAPKATGMISAEGESMTDSVDYRKAFMNYLMTGEVGRELRNVTSTSDTGYVIPTTIMTRIIEKLEHTGTILPKVTRTNIKGGVSYPVSNIKLTATWVAEGAGSEKQKKTANAQVVFAYHKLRCAVSVTLEVATVTLDAFETLIANNIAEAMTRALEASIFTGTGVQQPKGILSETVVAGQNVDIAASGSVEYATLIEAEGALPLAYEKNAEWFMSKKTFMAFEGLVDQAGQPIARTNYGIAGKPERYLLGRPVNCVEYMKDVNGAIAEDTVVAFLFDMKDYVINTNLQMTVKKYEDNETDDQVTKAILLADGKVIDNGSLVTVTKKHA